MRRMQLFCLALSLVTLLLGISCGAPASPAPTAPPAKPKAPSALATSTSAPSAMPSPTTAPAQLSPTPVAAVPKVQPTTSRAPLSPPVAVKFGVIGSSSDAPIYIALDNGYFKEEGLEVTLEPIKGGTEVVPLLATGQLDTAGGAVNPGLLNAIIRGVNVRAVADKGSFLPGFGYQSLVIRKDLIDSGKVKDFKDLKGKRIAVNTATSIAALMLSKILEKGGLTLNDVELVELPFADQVTALGNGAIDAATPIEPLVARSVEMGLGVNFISVDKVAPNFASGTVMYGEQFVKSKAEAARRFMVAYIKGIRDYNDAFLKNKGKPEVLAILTKNTDIKDKALWEKIIPPGFNPDGRLDKPSLDQTQDFFLSRKLIPQKVDMAKLVDDSYVDFALQQLGSYSR